MNFPYGHATTGLLALATLVAVHSNARAAEIIVPDDIASLSVALQVAEDGDTITIMDGIYSQFPGYAFANKALHVRSVNGPGSVILDMFDQDRVLTIAGANSAGTILEGLTIRGGGGVDAGAGVYAEQFITIENCVLEDNVAVNPAGALRCLDGAMIRNTTFRNNELTQLTHGDGGAAYLTGAASYTIENCLFENNYAANTGGALRIDGSTAQITRCMFEGNWTDTAADQLGGAVFSRSGAKLTFDACRFVGNTTEQRGGAIASLDSGTFTTVRNCIFQNNHADIRAGAIAMDSGSDVLVINTTFESNTAPTYASIATNNAGSTATVRNSILWNTPPATSQLGAVGGGSAPAATRSIVQGGYGGAGNIDVDPLVVDVTNDDLHLTDGSPAIDAGDSTAYAGPFADHDGASRGVDHPDVVDTGFSVYGPVVDIGAFEFQVDPGSIDPECPSDLNDDGSIDVADLLSLLSDWGACP
jgi:predicted outer membrane repeat protein